MTMLCVFVSKPMRLWVTEFVNQFTLHEIKNKKENLKVCSHIPSLFKLTDPGLTEIN